MTNAISRSAVLRQLDEYIDLAIENQVHYSMCTVANFIEELPALDAAPVVRCKDCKHYKPQNQGAHRNCTTPYCTRVCTIKVSPDDFCSHGERKTGEAE